MSKKFIVMSRALPAVLGAGFLLANPSGGFAREDVLKTPAVHQIQHEIDSAILQTERQFTSGESIQAEHAALADAIAAVLEKELEKHPGHGALEVIQIIVHQAGAFDLGADAIGTGLGKAAETLGGRYQTLIGDDIAGRSDIDRYYMDCTSPSCS